MKVILKAIGDGLLLAVALFIFIGLANALGVGAIILLVLIGEWTGLGNDIFVCAVLFIATMKAWDFLAWVVGKIAERKERKKNQKLLRGMGNERDIFS